MIDFIGDIHGHADELESLLKHLGYSKHSHSYSHPDRKVLFVGDYIDRGPKIPRTLEIVRSMVEDGNAIALMGNHEYNAICFHYKHPEGGHLRKHTITNITQHYQTLNQFKNSQREYEDYLDWFLTLPLYYEDEAFRAVHACWDGDNIDFLRKTLVNDRLTPDLIYESVKENSALYLSIEDILKGKELRLPNDISFTDAEGIRRQHVRIKWWENPDSKTYPSLMLHPIDGIPDLQIDEQAGFNYYSADEKNVFFGHYWLTGEPALYRNNICCLDYSVAKNGNLVAYRYDGEEKLNNTKLRFL
jgi:hypothetical protein